MRYSTSEVLHGTTVVFGDFATGNGEGLVRTKHCVGSVAPVEWSQVSGARSSVDEMSLNAESKPQV